MPAQHQYDLLVIGAGAAGSTAATTAAGQGARVALVERDKIGGTCLNYGCDPTKTLIHITDILYDDRVIPWVTFTNPPLSHVGKTEEQLRKEGVKYKVGRMKFSESERAVANGQTEGLVKLLVGEQGNILGGHILGARADDLLAPIVVAMHARLPAAMLASTMLPYPTLSEAVRWAADRVK